MLKRAHKSDYIAFNIELVKAVEKHPCIYDYNLKEYCNREFVHNTWEKIAQNFNCPAKECKETWKNLRIVFSRNLKKQTSGTCATKKPYYLLESMSFLIPFMKFDNSSNKQLKPISEAIYYETTSDEHTSNRDEEEDDINSSTNEHSANTANISNLEIATIKEEYDSGGEMFLDQTPPRRKRQHEFSMPVEIEMESQSQKKNHKTSQATLIDSGLTTLCNFSDSNTVKRMSRGNSKHQFLMSLFPDVDDMDDTQFRLFRLEVCKLVSNIFTFQAPTAQPFNRTSF